MGEYTRQRQLAADLLERKGSPLTLYRLNRPAYSPINPSSDALTVALQTPGKGVVLPSIVKALREFDDFLRANPRYVDSFRAIYVAGLGLAFEPNVDDVIKTPEGFFRIVGRVTLDPDGQGVLLYTFGCVPDMPKCSLLFDIPDETIFLDGYEDMYLVGDDGETPILYE